MREIFIKDEPFGVGLDVTVVPPPGGERLDREFAIHSEALSYAEQLACERSWSIVDRSCEARL